MAVREGKAIMPSDTKILADLGWPNGVRIDKGGQAKVYKVNRTGEPESQWYAAKVVTREKGTQAYERFHKEVESLQAVSHPGIVSIIAHGSNEADDFHFYVMEYLEGFEPLSKIVRMPDNPFFKDAKRSLAVYLQILEALRACEGAGLVHRDLSLGNVLYNRSDAATRMMGSVSL
jgi:serine/threonine protein kinase